MPKFHGELNKTFAGGSKTAKFVKVFSLESFPLYGTLLLVLHIDVISCMHGLLMLRNVIGVFSSGKL